MTGAEKHSEEQWAEQRRMAGERVQDLGVVGLVALALYVAWVLVRFA